MSKSHPPEAYDRALRVLQTEHPPASTQVSLDEAWAAASKLEEASPQGLYALFSLFLRAGHGALLEPTRQAEVLSPLLKHMSSKLWAELSAQVRSSAPRLDLSRRLAEMLVRETEAADRRARARVPLDEVLPALRWALPNLLRGVSADIRAAHLGASSGTVTAYTDGRDIYLGASIAVFERREYNELVYVRLLAHEALHILEGSFDADAYAAAYETIATMVATSGLVEDSILGAREANLQNLCALFGPSEGLFFGLFNLVEDTRIERRFADHLPGLAPMMTSIDRAIAERGPPAVFADAAGQVLQVIHAKLHGERAPHVPSALEFAFREVDAWLPEFVANRRPRLLDAATLAARLTLWFLRHVPPATRASAAKTLSGRRPVRIPDVAVRVDLAPPGRRSLSVVRPRMTMPEDWNGLESDGIHVPEYDFWRSTLREPGARVVEREWDPDRATAQGRAVRLEKPESRGATHREAMFFSTGKQLDTERFVRFLSSVKAGAPVDPRVFRRRASARGAADTIAVVDLSISMIHYGPDGSRPLDRAVGVIESLAADCDGGASMTLFGSVDPGPHEVRLFRIKEHGRPLDRAVLESLHGYARGGFRVGPILRALATRHPEAVRTPVWLVTDTTNHYVTRGMNRIISFDTKLCADCPKFDSMCQMERPYPDEGWIYEKATLYEPLEYEIEDIRRALADTAEQLDVRTVLLGDHWGDDLCDYTWGPGRWQKL